MIKISNTLLLVFTIQLNCNWLNEWNKMQWWRLTICSVLAVDLISDRSLLHSLFLQHRRLWSERQVNSYAWISWILGWWKSRKLTSCFEKKCCKQNSWVRVVIYGKRTRKIRNQKNQISDFLSADSNIRNPDNLSDEIVEDTVTTAVGFISIFHPE